MKRNEKKLIQVQAVRLIDCCNYNLQTTSDDDDSQTTKTFIAKANRQKKNDAKRTKKEEKILNSNINNIAVHRQRYGIFLKFSI